MTTCTCNSFTSSTSTPAVTVTSTGASDAIQCSATNGSKSACWGDNSNGGYAIVGSASGSTSSVGVWGICHNANVGFGVKGSADGGGTGVLGLAGAGGIGGKFAGLYAYDPGNSSISTYTGNGCCAYFLGDTVTTGYVSKNGGGFLIDHPADPENFYINHEFVESDVARNIYDGEVIFDKNGEAKVTFDEWFDHINDKPQMTVTAQDQSMVGLFWSKIDSRTFRICGGIPDGKASWILNCNRADAWQKKNGKPVVVKKTQSKGTYLNPELYGKGNAHREHQIPNANAPEMALKRSDMGVK